MSERPELIFTALALGLFTGVSGRFQDSARMAIPDACLMLKAPA
jgi:hypothetical protein